MVETRVADGLWTAPIPEGGRLLEPGAAGAGARRGRAADDASAYGCVVSTLRADGSGPAYDYDAVYVHLPDRLVREAGGRVAHVTLALRSERAPAHAAARFEESEGRGGVVRVARCRLPESVEAGSLVKRALQEFRAGSWVQTQSAGASAQAAGGAAPAGATARASASTCAEWVEVWWCTTVTASGSDYEYTRCEFEGYECARYVSVSEDPWDGGDPPGSGDDPDPCPEGPTDQLCQDGGGIVPTNPEPDPDPCDDEYEPVLSDPAVYQGFEGLWVDSNPEAPLSERVEQAAWIVETSSGGLGLIRVTPDPNAELPLYCGTTPLGGRPAGAIGYVHTHPVEPGTPLPECPFYDPVTNEYRPREAAWGPSSQDYLWALSQELEHNYILDRDEIWSYKADGWKRSIPACGYDAPDDSRLGPDVPEFLVTR